MRLGVKGRWLAVVLRKLLDDLEGGLAFSKVGAALVLTNWNGVDEIMYHRSCLSFRVKGHSSIHDVWPVHGEVRLWVGRLPTELSDLVNAVLVEISAETASAGELYNVVQGHLATEPAVDP